MSNVLAARWLHTVLQSDADRFARLCAAAYALHGGLGSTKRAWVAHDRLKELMGVADSTACKAKAWLEENGFLQMVSRPGPGKAARFELTGTSRAVPQPRACRGEAMPMAWLFRLLEAGAPRPALLAGVALADAALFSGRNPQVSFDEMRRLTTFERTSLREGLAWLSDYQWVKASGPIGWSELPAFRLAYPTDWAAADPKEELEVVPSIHAAESRPGTQVEHMPGRDAIELSDAVLVATEVADTAGLELSREETVSAARLMLASGLSVAVLSAGLLSCWAWRPPSSPVAGRWRARFVAGRAVAMARRSPRRHPARSVARCAAAHGPTSTALGRL